MKKEIGIISLLTIISIIAIIPKSYGALNSKPTTKTDGSNVLVNTTVSNSYLLCQQMKSNGESLYGTTVKPHLATNKDWGAVSYLSNSIYGTNTAGKNTGVEVTINGVIYRSTTGNASGVMNWGSNKYKGLYTQTAGLISNYSSGNDNVTELYNNRETEYVDFINPGTASLTIGMAIQETSGRLGGSFYAGTSTTYPSVVRSGLFGGYFGTSSSGSGHANRAVGAAQGDATFRPVVWN